MLGTRHIALACCSENKTLADKIINDLAHADYSITAVQCNSPANSLSEALANHKGKVILLLTDNLLKSSDCLNGLLAKIRELIGEERLIPIVAEGRIPLEDGSGWQPIATSFDKVSNVIKYMNYWQDRYLELRRKVRNTQEDKNLDREVELTRVISGEVGEMLRLLRTFKSYQYDAFCENGYVLFFKMMADIRGHQKLMEALGTGATTDSRTGIERSLVELIEDNSQELISENLELDAPGFDPLDEEIHLEGFSEEELASIPGLGILNKSVDFPSEKPENTDEELERTENTPAKLSSKQKEFANQEISNFFLDDLPELKNTPFDSVDELLDELLNEEEEEEEEEVDLVFEDEEDEGIEDDFEEFFESEAATDDTPPRLKELAPIGQQQSKKIRFPSAEEALDVGIKLFEAGREEQAIGFLQGAVEGRPDDISLRYYYAYALARYAQQFNRATAELKVLLKLEPNHVDAWFLLAELEEIQKNYKNAKHCFLHVAKLKPTYPDVFYRLGLLSMLHLENQEPDALKYFEAALELDPKNIDALYRFATLQNEFLDEPEMAVLNFRRVLKANPEHPFANYDLALLYYQLDDKDLAFEFYQKAVEINPELKTERNESVFQPQEEDSIESLEPNEKAKITIVNESDFSESESQDSGITNPIDITEKEKMQETTIQPLENESKNSKHQTVLITGATAGIGLATARLFAENGYRLIITGRRADRLEDLKNELENNSKAQVHTLSFDVRDINQVQNAIDSLPENWKQVDILINNAGLSKGLSPIHEGDTEHWDLMIDTNIKGLLYLTRAITPQMVKRGSGHVINLASSAGKEVYPSGNVYCATKFAVEGLTKAMRLDLYQHNIKVSQVSPGHVEETEFARVRFDWDQERATKVYEGFQPLKSSDVAEALYFIATRPAHVNIQDVLMFGTQQASNNHIDRSGRKQ